MFLYFKQPVRLFIQITLSCILSPLRRQVSHKHELNYPSAVNISHFSGIRSVAATDDSCTCSQLQLHTVRSVIYCAQRTQR